MHTIRSRVFGLHSPRMAAAIAARCGDTSHLRFTALPPALRQLSTTSPVPYSSTKAPGALAPPEPLINAAEPGKVQLFRMLQLNEFSDAELSSAHAQVTAATSTPDSAVHHLSKQLKLVSDDGVVLPQAEFSGLVKKEGEALDIRVWPIALSFAATGLSIGVIIPILPILVHEINLPNSIFGVAVASFGLGKLIGNVPTAQWVEQHGRKPVMVGGMVVCAAGLGSLGFTLLPELGAPWLIGCRLVTGLGVAAFTSGAFMYMSDISTSLNRTRTMAPVMSSFQAGTAVGPALGGFAVAQLGILQSYATVGTTIAVLAAANQMFLNESKAPAAAVVAVALPASTAASTSASASAVATEEAGEAQEKGDEANGKFQGSSFALAFREWKRLMVDRKIRDVVLLNLAYWVALSGTQFTMLPLFMVSEPLLLDAGHLGIFFSSLSAVSVAVAQPAAAVADKYGKVPSLLAGTSLLTLAFASIPFASTFEGLMLAGAPLALGGTILSAVPTAHMSDLTNNEDRAQALALLRTAGDVGLLTGAMGSGLLSEVYGMGHTMQGNAVLLGSALSWFALRHYSRKQMVVKAE